MIPKDVLLDCARVLGIPEAAGLVERRVLHAGTPADQATIDRILAAVAEPGALRLHSVARWRSYLTTMHFKFYEVWNHLRQAKRERVGADFRAGSGGEVYVSTDAFTALPIAASLYQLDSWNVQGGVIECGCFKGVSSAMLSWSCKLLGRRLWVADSFNGLPAVDDANESYYRRGDYSGSLDEVRRMVRTFGCEDVVTYVPGYFEESLPFLREPFALIWADVDLKLSMASVLQWLMPQLHPDGLFFSDEVPASAFDGPRLREEAVSVPAAIRDYFATRQIGVPGQHLNHNVSAFAPGASGMLFLTFPRVQGLPLHANVASRAAGA